MILLLVIMVFRSIAFSDPFDVLRLFLCQTTICRSKRRLHRMKSTPRIHHHAFHSFHCLRYNAGMSLARRYLSLANCA